MQWLLPQEVPPHFLHFLAAMAATASTWSHGAMVQRCNASGDSKAMVFSPEMWELTDKHGDILGILFQKRYAAHIEPHVRSSAPLIRWLLISILGLDKSIARMRIWRGVQQCLPSNSGYDGLKLPNTLNLCFWKFADFSWSGLGSPGTALGGHDW